jgi:ABC-type Fe3+/spermidine/putrescine transport system ATPase subunit
VAGIDGLTATVTLVSGDALRLAVDRLPEARVGSSVKVGVRPEKISIGLSHGDAGTDHNALRGRVRVSTFTGVGNQYLVEMPWGADLTVYAQNIGQASAPRSGDDVVLTWPIEHTFAVRPMTPGTVQDDPTMGDSDER